MTEHTRTRIAAAFERELARSPVPPGLTAQVLRDKVRVRRHVEPQPGHRRGGWMMGLQDLASLVAVVLVVVLIATLLVGNRLRHDWNRFNTTPAPVTRVDPAQLAPLRARPLDLPVLAAGAACPTGPLTTITAGPGSGNASGGALQVYGDGPAYMFDAGGIWYPTEWGSYWTMTVLLQPSLTGPVLIRGQDLQGGQPLVFVGAHAAGSVMGTGLVLGETVQHHVEVVLDVSRPDKSVSGFDVWTIFIGHAQTSAPYLCAGFQIDGPRFSESLVTFPLAGSNNLNR